MTQEKLGQNPEIRSETGQRSARLAKTHEDYWKARLRRRSYKSADGAFRKVPEWQVKLFRDGRQRWINLETANKDAAARKARDLWMRLKTNGWDAVKPQREKIADPSVGDFLAAVRAEADLQPGTFEIYAKKFRRLVVGVIGVEESKRKFDHAGGGHREWLTRVELVKLSRLTPETIQRWKIRYIASVGTNPLREKRARRTIASILISSKALFSPKVIGRLHLALPNPLPLAGVEIQRIRPSQYVSKIEPLILFHQARRELEDPAASLLRLELESAQPFRKRIETAEARSRRIESSIDRERFYRRQMFRVFCLGLLAGLRRDEIDSLTWAQINYVNHSIRIETNEHTRAKSDGSEVAVDIDAAFSEMIRTWMKDSHTKFVIDVNTVSRPEVSTYHHYRCDLIFKKLNAWLKVHGIDELKALHVLRKEFGTQINSEHGLFAASSALRHSSIQLTRAVYVAKKDRTVFALPGLQPASKGEVAS